AGELGAAAAEQTGDAEHLSGVEGDGRGHEDALGPRPSALYTGAPLRSTSRRALARSSESIAPLSLPTMVAVSVARAKSALMHSPWKVPLRNTVIRSLIA